MAVTRRDVLSGLVGSLFNLGIVGGSEMRGLSSTRSDTGRSAVVFLSRSGNTRVVAGQLQRAFKADSFELKMATPWPDEYEAMVAWASRLKEAGTLPPLANTVPDLKSYDTLFLGSPIWDSSLPSPIRTFLSQRDLAEKRIVPFFTYGCCGAGNAAETIAALAPHAKVAKPFTLKCDQERDTMNSVNAWLHSTNLTAK